MPASASAVTTYYDYNQDYYQLRATLIAQIYALLAALEAQQNNQYYSYYNYYSNSNYGGRVLGANTGFSNSVVEVQTFEPSTITPDEAWVFGEIDLNGVTYAKVWFEFGDSTNLYDRSNVGRIDRFVSDSFRAELQDLDHDTKYYYRAVAEDPSGKRSYGRVLSFTTTGSRGSSRSNDDEPDADTGRAYNIGAYRASFDGEVDMNDFRNGKVFFAYGEDEDQIEDIADDYDEYRDIDEDGDDLQLIIVDNDLDNDRSYDAYVTGLNRDTRYYFTICVEFEDEDDDSKIICGDVEDFETDRN